jgi:C-terminal processing protease CtpA/Prc
MKKLIYFILAIFIFNSCDIVLMESDPENTPVKNFEILWKTLDEKYSFFTYKNIDWNAVYDKYSPLVNNDMSDEELFDVCSDMLYELRDGHVNLSAPFDFTRNWQFFLNSPQNFDYNLLERNYWGEDIRRTGAFWNKEIDGVGYIYYGSFSSGVSNSDLDYILKKFENTKGIIIDVRDNGGGNPFNAFTIAERFADQRRLVYREEFKNGPGHDDFASPIDVYIEPKGDFQYTKPVIVLTNRSCYSATNTFISCMMAFPHVTIMGDTSGGGGGVPSGAELPNGWYYRFSASQSFLPDGFNTEHGLPPDVQVDMKKEDMDLGLDTILEEALKLLK